MRSTRKTDPHPSFIGTYPQPVGSRSSLNFGWETFATRAEAERVAEWSILRKQWHERRGYVFGVEPIGEITELADGTFEVCVP